jgi:hypothetical protein
MVREVSVHDNHKVAGAEIEPVNVCSPGMAVNALIELLKTIKYPRPSLPARARNSYNNVRTLS